MWRAPLQIASGRVSDPPLQAFDASTSPLVALLVQRH